MIEGLLIDIKGVLYENKKPIEGAKSFIHFARRKKVQIRFLTNTTVKNKSHILKDLIDFGFEVKDSEIITPAIAAALLLKQRKIKKIYLACKRSLFQDFSQFQIDDKDPDAVILGDLGKDFNYNILNTIFQKILNGPQLIALHENRYSREDKSLVLDLGPFVKALEYASNKKADIVGKPAKNFFKMAIASMKVDMKNILMVGDDLDADVGGAQSIGIKAAQVQTGKFTNNDIKREDIQPDYRIKSIADLETLLIKLG
jgi:HAD superfamily hydrolase (TIGR01458 family)